MTEQTPPAGSAARPIPDLGFFGNPVAPARSQLPPPPGQFGPPPGPFGGPPVTPFGAGPPMVYPPYPAVQQRGGMPGWAIALIAVVVSVFLVMVLAAIAIPTFLDQRARAHTPQIPDRIGQLTKSSDASLQRQAQSLADQQIGQRGPQGSAFVDATGTQQVFVYTGAFVTPKSEGEVADYERGFWSGFSSSEPVGFGVGPATSQPSRDHGVRVTCSDVLANTAAGDQVPVGRACLAIDAWTSVSTVDLSAAGVWDPALIHTVREAVLPRR